MAFGEITSDFLDRVVGLDHRYNFILKNGHLVWQKTPQLALEELLVSAGELNALVAGGGGSGVLGRVDTKAALEALDVPGAVSQIEILGYTAANDGGGHRLKRAVSEPAHALKIQSDDGTWWEHFESVIDPRQGGAKVDHVRNTATGTDDVEAFRAVLTASTILGRPIRWTGGMVFDCATLTANGPLMVDGDAPFIGIGTEGMNPADSWITLINGDFDDYFLQIGDRLGLWNGDVESQYVDGHSPYPPQRMKRLYIGGFAVYGEGTDDAGASVALQKGISLNGRQDNVTMHYVYCYNINGPAYHFGYSPDGSKAGIRESVFDHVVAYRCGRETLPAWIVDGGYDNTFGPNFLNFLNCEHSVSRGDGFLLRNENPNNSSHAISFINHKCHGTGTDGAIPLPWSRRAWVIEGNTSNSIIIDSILMNQWATQAGDHTVALVEGLGRKIIDLSGATPIGDMSAAAGLAAAFDGNRDKIATASAGKDAATVAWIGVTLAVPSTVVRGLVFGSFDQGLVVGSNPVVTLEMYGKQGAAPASSTDGTLLVTTSVTDKTGSVFRTMNAADTTTVWDHVWCRLTIGAGANIRVCDLSFFEGVITYPEGVKITTSFSSVDNGVLIEGGGGHVIDIIDSTGVDGAEVTLGADVFLPSVITMPNTGITIASDAAVSHMALIKDDKLTADALTWTRYERLYTDAPTINNTTTLVGVPFLSFIGVAGATYKFLFHVDYSTTAAADFKYTVNSTTTLSAISAVTRERAPGAVVYTVAAPSASLPANDTILAAVAGHGAVEVEAIVTVDVANTTINMRFAQNTADAGPTIAKAGSWFEMKRLA